MNLAVIKQLRKQKKMSLAQISKQTGISANTLSAIENNKTDPGISKVSAMLSCLGYDLGVVVRL